MRNLKTEDLNQVTGGLIIGPFGVYFRVIAATIAATSGGGDDSGSDSEDSSSDG